MLRSFSTLPCFHEKANRVNVPSSFIVSGWYLVVETKLALGKEGRSVLELDPEMCSGSDAWNLPAQESEQEAHIALQNTWGQTSLDARWPNSP